MGEDKKYRITYLFGAGASIGKTQEWLSDVFDEEPKSHPKKTFEEKIGRKLYGVPITEQLERMRTVFSRNNLDKGRPADENFTLRKLFLDEKLQHAFSSQLSPDTYGKVLLVKQDQQAYHKYKLELSLFFSLLEGISLPDVRYGHLIANFIDQQSGKLPITINFLSYNYDSNLERAFEQFMVDLKPCKDYFEQVRRHFGFISRIDDSNDRKVSRVVKLNGTASIVDKKLENQLETDSLIGYPNVEISRECILVPLPSVAGDQPFINGYKRIENQMAKLSRIYKKFHVSPDDFVPNLCFSWDTDENHTVLKAGLDVMSHSDVLVVIGYSFPAFNLANDIKLLKAFADGGGNKVYIQLPKGSAQEAEGRVKQIFSSMGHAVEIQVIENCGQFYIPSEYFESKPPIIGSYVAFSSRNGGIDMI